MTLELNHIYNVDCIDGMKQLDSNSIDLIITSPPYNVDLGNNKYHKTSYDLYNDNKEHYEYIMWLKSIFELLYIKMSIGGRVCINIGDGKNGAIPTSSDIIQFMKELRYIPITHIIWDKSQVGNRTSWGSWLSPSCPSFPTPFEHILVFCKESKKLQHNGISDLTKEEFIEYSLSLWKFAPEIKQKEYNHSAMFPEKLPYRCIKMFSYINDLVLDPFCGVGTTCAVAKRLHRNFIGFDISKKYCELADKRIDNVVLSKKLGGV